VAGCESTFFHIIGLDGWRNCVFWADIKILEEVFLKKSEFRGKMFDGVCKCR
jgi:hypothetical protein